MLSLLWPGLGQIYCGRLVRGIGLLVGLYVIKYFGVFVLNDFCPVNNVTLFTYIILLFLPQIILAIDASIIAAKTSNKHRLKEYNRWYCYLCVVFLLSGFYHACTQQLVNKYIQPTKILSSSLFPTFQVKDRAVIYKNRHGKIEPKVGDIVEFPHYAFSKTPLVKRVVACAGDTVEIKNNRLIINDVPLQLTAVRKTTHQSRDLEEPEEKSPSYTGTIYIEHNRNAAYTVFLIDDPNCIEDFKKHKVPPDSVFVLGDSRNLSYDSRYFGYVPIHEVQGTAKYLIWTGRDWHRWGLIDSQENITSQNDPNSSTSKSQNTEKNNETPPSS